MTRPSFTAAWAASMRIDDPAKLRWKNTCAVRLSYILNQAGLHIPHILGQTVSGSDKRWQEGPSLV